MKGYALKGSKIIKLKKRMLSGESCYVIKDRVGATVFINKYIFDLGRGHPVCV